jgi:hypothetical protein
MVSASAANARKPEASRTAIPPSTLTWMPRSRIVPSVFW